MKTILLITFLIGFQGVWGEHDPCVSNQALVGDERSTANTRTSLNHSCDMGLVKGWYRFNSHAGVAMKIPTHKVPVNRCGTFSTVTLKGPHPDERAGIVTAEVCANIADISVECAWPWKIRVKNCGEFFVYELVPTPYCPMGYCTEIQDTKE